MFVNRYGGSSASSLTEDFVADLAEGASLRSSVSSGLRIHDNMEGSAGASTSTPQTPAAATLPASEHAADRSCGCTISTHQTSIDDGANGGCAGCFAQPHRYFLAKLFLQGNYTANFYFP